MKNTKLALILIGILTGCDKPQLPVPPPRPALVIPVGDHAEIGTMVLVGEVRPRYESSQGFRIDGKIIARKVDVGDRVKKGQIIAKLDPADLKLNASAAQSGVSSATADRNLAAAELTRYRQLFAKKFVSASALDIKIAELKTADARLTQAKAQESVATNQMQYTDLQADRDGVVTMIRAEPGQVVETGNVIVQIADTNALEILVAVPELHMRQLKPYAPVGIKLWASQEKIYSGRVREISPSADSATRAFNVRIAVENPDEALKLGMTARVKLNSQDSLENRGLRIPNAALTEINGKPTVWVINSDNKAEPREVVAGQFSEEGVLITGGLQTGELIAVAGVHTLTKGQPVKPVIGSAP